MFAAVACIRAADADLRRGARSPSLSAARRAGHVSLHGQRYW
jgi:hypothetical protein